MLVLTRKTNERILVGNDVVITIVRVGPTSVRIGIDAPGHVPILRAELTEKAAENGELRNSASGPEDPSNGNSPD